MRQAVQALVVVLILATCGGLLSVFVVRVREAAGRVQCQNNLRQLGLSVENYRDTYERYPPAAMPNAGLPPEKRLSWLVHVMPFVEANDIYSRMDKTKGWDAEENRFAALLIFKTFQCPSYPDRPPTSTLLPAHYIGIAGIGEDAASLPAGDARAGFFGYEQTLHSKDLVRGASETAVATETSAAEGAWTAAGPPTVRGYDPATSHFGGNHRGTCLLLFADASVRMIDAKMSDAEWKRMAVLVPSGSQER
jgi:hypothetical protein